MGSLHSAETADGWSLDTMANADSSPTVTKLDDWLAEDGEVNPCRNRASRSDVPSSGITTDGAQNLTEQRILRLLKSTDFVPTEPDAVLYRGFLPFPCREKNFEKAIGNVDPFLRLRRETSADVPRAMCESFGADAFGPLACFVIVENIADFPVVITPRVYGLFIGECGEQAATFILEPGEFRKLTRFSTDEVRYRMDCYSSGLPHLPCDGISNRVDPRAIFLACRPAARDSEGWHSMTSRDGVRRPEVWSVYIDFVDEGATCNCYLKYELMETFEFLDERRPLKRVNIPLEDIRYCQDSCGTTFRDGRLLESTVKELQKGETTTAWLGIRVVNFGGVHFALDNRRLKCTKLAFPPTTHPHHTVAVLLADLSDPLIKQEWDAKFTAGKRISTHDEARQEGACSAHQSSQREAASQHRKQARQKQAEAVDLRDHGPPTSSSTTCSQCRQLLPKESFSAAQLKKREARRCRSCVGR